MAEMPRVWAVHLPDGSTHRFKFEFNAKLFASQHRGIVIREEEKTK